MKFKTTEAYPDGYEIITLADGDDIRALLQNAATDKVVIVFPQGMEYTATSTEAAVANIKIPENIKSVYFWGAAGDTKPSLKFKGVSFESS